MSGPTNNLYFVAIIPPSPVYEEVVKWKEYFSKNYQSEKALNSPPHITILRPFWSMNINESMMEESLEAVCKGLNATTIKVQNFAAFEPKTIFLDVEKSDALSDIKTRLTEFALATHLFNYREDDRPFNPHLTVAFRDLSKANFYKAWEEMKTKTYEASFIADTISLLKHDRKKWNVHAGFALRKK